MQQCSFWCVKGQQQRLSAAVKVFSDLFLKVLFRVHQRGKCVVEKVDFKTCVQIVLHREAAISCE